jgi:hypothetical protein
MAKRCRVKFFGTFISLSHLGATMAAIRSPSTSPDARVQNVDLKPSREDDRRRAVMSQNTAHIKHSYTLSAVEASATDLPIAPVRRWLRSASRRVWLALSATWAAVMGLLPHVLHHAGPLAGAALFAGVTGSLLFGVLGLIVAIPFLRRMHRRFGTWRAPAIALVLFAAVFSLSTFVIGPKINGEGGGAQAAQETPGTSPPPASSHEAHHE